MGNVIMEGAPAHGKLGGTAFLKVPFNFNLSIISCDSMILLTWIILFCLSLSHQKYS